MFDQSFINPSSFAYFKYNYYLAQNNHLMVLPQLCNDKDRMVVTNPSSRTELDLWHIQPENGSRLEFLQSQGKMLTKFLPSNLYNTMGLFALQLC